MLTGNHINDTVKFGCDKGFALLGQDTLLCIINDSHTGGKWSNSIPICQCKSNKTENNDHAIIHFHFSLGIFSKFVNCYLQLKTSEMILFIY